MLFPCFQLTKNLFTAMTYAFLKLSLQSFSIKFKIDFLSTSVIYYAFIIEWMPFHSTSPHFPIYWVQLKSRAFTSTNYFPLNLKILWAENSSVKSNAEWLFRKCLLFSTPFFICVVQNSKIISRKWLQFVIHHSLFNDFIYKKRKTHKMRWIYLICKLK